MGGSDDPSNLIELSVEDHAEAHKKLWEQYGLIKDKFAWLGLSGQIDKDEILHLIYVENGKKQGKKNVESGHMSKLHSIGGKIGGKISGKKNVESGHLQSICKLGGQKAIEKRIKQDPNYQKKCFAKLLEKYPDNQSKAGKLGAKRATRKMLSLTDGKITTRNQIPAYERKTKIKHEWKEYDQEI
jgi:hypothetical protein